MRTRRLMIRPTAQYGGIRFLCQIGGNLAMPAHESRQHAGEIRLRRWHVRVSCWNGRRHNMVTSVFLPPISAEIRLRRFVEADNMPVRAGFTGDAYTPAN